MNHHHHHQQQNTQEMLCKRTRMCHVYIGVIIFLFVLMSVGGAVLMRHHYVSNPYPLIDPARNLIAQEHFLSTIEPLRRALKSYVEAEKIEATIYVEYLNTGANIHINPDGRYWPASLTKLPIAIATMSTIEQGTWSLNTKLFLEERDRDPKSSELYTYPAGTPFSIGELLDKLLKVSDNTAYRILLRNLPESEISAMMQAIGLEQLFDANGRIGSKEYSRFFRILYSASFLSRENSQYLLEILNETKFTSFLRVGIPEYIPFPHKFGINLEGHSFNDSGIVYIPNRPYLITVILQGDGSETEEQRAKEIMNHISKISYAYFSQAK